MDIEKLFKTYNTEDVLSSLIEMQISPSGRMRNIRIPTAEYLISNLIRYHVADSKETYTPARFSEVMDFGYECITSRSNPVGPNWVFRGDGYMKQTAELANLLFAPFDKALEEKLGFTYTCCEKVVVYILKEYALRLSRAIKDTKSYGGAIKSLFAGKKQGAVNPSIAAGYAFRIAKEELYKAYGRKEIDSMIEVFGIRIGDPTLAPVGLNGAKPLHERPFVDFGKYIYLPLPELTLKNLHKLFHGKLTDTEIFSGQTVEQYKNKRIAVIGELAKKHLKKLSGGEEDVSASFEAASVFLDCGSLSAVSALKGYTADVEAEINRAVEASCGEAAKSKKGYDFVLCVTPENFGAVLYAPDNAGQKDQASGPVPLIMTVFDLEILANECKNGEEFAGYLGFRKRNCRRLLSVDDLYAFWLYKKYGNADIEVGTDQLATMEYILLYDKKYFAEDSTWIRKYRAG